MKVSGFTFIRNGEILGYPFVESIKSILPICDEFVVNVGKSEDRTLELVRDIGSSKIRIIESCWNEKMQVRGYVYGQQKNIAQFNCTGDWAFYLEGDEVVHENDLDTIHASMQKYLNDDRVEALVFDYYHFYGNANTYLWSPGWYRRAPRIIKNTIRSYSPDGLFFVVLDKNKAGRYPRAAHVGAKIYHYGWVRPENLMNRKSQYIERYWAKPPKKIDYTQIDSKIFCEFSETHPSVIVDWLPKDAGIFIADPGYKLTLKEKKHRLMLVLERWFGLELSKTHFKMVR